MFVPEYVRYVIILILVCVHGIESASILNLIEENVSSHSCRLLSSTLLDCSNLTLTELPHDIPNTILSLNLSSNQLHLNQSTFASCCGNLLTLDLSNNDISNISQGVFRHLVNIKTIILRNNSISEFDSETFSNLKHLEKLDLSKNPLILQKEFINNSNLKELKLNECNLGEIPDEAFSGMKQLEILTLSGNPLDLDLETSPFEDLTSLTTLEIKNISQDSITDLCGKLTAIDTINLEGFNFSCYIYMLEENFEDAIVGNDLPIEQPLTILRTISRTTTTSSTISTTLATTISTIHNSTVTINTNDQIIQQPDVETAEPEVVDHATVDIDNETIKYILVGIIAVTMTGIFIGFVCRTDVFGIKTKMCRSKKANNNRRTPADTVSPFEEIPLNTVNSNGKNTENQG